MAANGRYAPRPGNIPGVAMNMGGVELVLAPLGIRLAREFQQQTRKLLDDKAGEAEFIDLGLRTIHASLLRNYPDIELEEVAALVDTFIVQEAVKAITDGSGLKRVTPGEIQTEAVILSTGTPSTPTS